ncbi:hypothetical protein BCF33_0166 [Hasllibacter halocynthiae]|uniref:Uncharacterized protein n=1 Tax=Hasllibacter halocynthiae TaxID=595589 RepID=A0A2T0X6S5_9RHOB|nr:DUF6497 family protein [Hasllibacter halocynthiae]PRY94574.1 hypothetical protein BCF33_0166 [Hasllibacter halocynthiae]
MRRAALLCLLGGGALADGLPSGLAPVLEDARIETRPGMAGEEVWATFRFIAEGLTDYEQVAGDFDPLCAGVARPALVAAGREADVIVVALTDRPVPRGAVDLDAVQFFESFVPSAAGCDPLQW